MTTFGDMTIGRSTESCSLEPLPIALAFRTGLALNCRFPNEREFGAPWDALRLDRVLRDCVDRPDVPRSRDRQAAVAGGRRSHGAGGRPPPSFVAGHRLALLYFAQRSIASATPEGFDGPTVACPHKCRTKIAVDPDGWRLKIVTQLSKRSAGHDAGRRQSFVATRVRIRW